MLKKIVVRGLTFLLVLFALAFWALFFSPRPPLTTDPATLAGDGSLINYCDLPVLDGGGLRAADIPKGNTPGCAYSHFPLPILAQCTEPLAKGAADIRGLWIAVDSGKIGHVERVEQCGSRVVVTTAGIIHDGGPNSSGGLTSNDTEGAVLFTLGDKEYCPRSTATMDWNDGVLEFRAFGLGPVVVKRYLDGEQLVWEYIDGSTSRMDRICTLPEDHKYPAPRGKRFKLF
jgi:hypothetical protein